MPPCRLKALRVRRPGLANAVAILLSSVTLIVIALATVASYIMVSQKGIKLAIIGKVTAVCVLISFFTFTHTCTYPYIHVCQYTHTGTRRLQPFRLPGSVE